jgi:hypothetical protein
MKFISSLSGLTLVTAISILDSTAYAQGVPTATQRLRLSTFIATTDTSTNLAGGNNLDITAGGNLTFLTFRLFRPSVEVRGPYPIDKGHTSSQKNFLVGPKIEYPLGRLCPYANFFVGRGKIDYHDPGFIFDNFRYVSSTTVVYSPGVGLDYNLTHTLGIKIDVQLQRWNTPATSSGTINPMASTLGAIYTFDLNGGHRHGR